ncbi:hypothetical protein D3C84_984130 [compost metagenome]
MIERDIYPPVDEVERVVDSDVLTVLGFFVIIYDCIPSGSDHRIGHTFELARLIRLHPLPKVSLEVDKDFFEGMFDIGNQEDIFTL